MKWFLGAYLFIAVFTLSSQAQQVEFDPEEATGSFGNPQLNNESVELPQNNGNNECGQVLNPQVLNPEDYYVEEVRSSCGNCNNPCPQQPCTQGCNYPGTTFPGTIYPPVVTGTANTCRTSFSSFCLLPGYGPVGTLCHCNVSVYRCSWAWGCGTGIISVPGTVSY